MRSPHNSAGLAGLQAGLRYGRAEHALCLEALCSSWSRFHVGPGLWLGESLEATLGESGMRKGYGDLFDENAAGLGKSKARA